MGSRRALRHLSRWSLVLLVAVMAYGMYEFPRAPFRKVDGTYVDKAGASHTEEEFERLRTWQRVFVVSWGVSFASALAVWRASRRRTTS